MNALTSSTGTGYCSLHGQYVGVTCPSCNTARPLQPQPQAWSQDPTPAYHRIATALERIAAALEAANAEGVTP